tara:strand:+ start:91 stop:735 length:645 start_codon:yes stop_codon:yes gene_type:complete
MSEPKKESETKWPPTDLKITNREWFDFMKDCSPCEKKNALKIYEILINQKKNNEYIHDLRSVVNQNTDIVMKVFKKRHKKFKNLASVVNAQRIQGINDRLETRKKRKKFHQYIKNSQGSLRKDIKEKHHASPLIIERLRTAQRLGDRDLKAEIDGIKRTVHGKRARGMTPVRKQKKDGGGKTKKRRRRKYKKRKTKRKKKKTNRKTKRKKYNKS